MRAGMALVLALVLVVTSCRADSGAPPGLERFYSQQLTWRPCTEFAGAEDVESHVRCAHVTVPLDYARPDGRTIRITLSRVRAKGARMGSVLFIPGGPGESGLSMADRDRGLVAERFDQIGWDPRGIGASEPAVRCVDDTQIDRWRLRARPDRSPSGIAHAELENRAFAASCAAAMTPEVLAHLGTRETARDMDVIRAVLGEAKLTAVGYSYGTRVGTAFAETFPDKVRALVLDGAVDPDKSPLADAVDQMKAFQRAFEVFAADCVQRPNCPLGRWTNGAVHRFWGLVRPLLDAPAPTMDGRGLFYGDAIDAAISSLYSPQGWELLRAGLWELQHGHGDLLLRIADFHLERSAHGAYPRGYDAGTAVSCLDTPRTADPAELDRKIREAAPFADDGRATGAAARDVCAFWPVPETFVPHELSVPGLPKVVVVSVTGDPATPHVDGFDLARQLHASLITYEGWQHTVTFHGVPCVDDAVTRYLVDLVVPDDTICHPKS